MASEIRVNKINNRAGLGTVTYTDTGIVVSGISTASNFKTGTSNLHSTGLNIQDLDVDGHTNLDNVSVGGATTISGDLRIQSALPSIYLTDTNNNPDYLLYNSNGNFEIRDPSSGTRLQVTTSGNVNIFRDLDVDGHTNLDNVSVAGVLTATTFKGDGSQLTGLAADKIFENNTKVEVVDSGTGYITAEVDGTEALRIKENGYFGLGTNSPVQDLHIRRDNAALRIETPSGSTLQASTGGISANFGTISNSNLNFVISNSTKMKLNTDGHLIPGTDSQHDLGLTGTRWRNVYADTYYGDGANLTNLPAGAPVGGASTNTVFFENDKEVAVNYQVTSTKNAMSAGPVAINAGIAVTVPSGCVWTIV